jgi:hypothetical protein
MALTDDLKDYIARNSTTRTEIKENHNVAIVGEWHAVLNRAGTEIRTKAVVRLLLELLADPKYRYFANENYLRKGPIGQGVENYLRNKVLPPAFDPKQTDLDVEEIGRRVLVRRYQPVLDFLRIHPRYILSIGSPIVVSNPARDAELAQNFFGEFMARDLGPGDLGVLLLGASHAERVSHKGWPNVRMELEKRGFNCVSIYVVTDLIQEPNAVPDDAVFDRDKAPGQRQPNDIIRLTSLVDRTPVTIATNRVWAGNQESPFWRVSLFETNVPLPTLFEYIVLQKA